MFIHNKKSTKVSLSTVPITIYLTHSVVSSAPSDRCFNSAFCLLTYIWPNYLHLFMLVIS